MILLVWLHFLSDFLLQTDKMALGKSTSIKWLSIHVVTYSIPFCLIGWKFAIVNGGAHWVVDFLSSRACKWAHEQGRRGLFFKIIGLDQALHLTILFLTYGIFIR